MQKIVRQKQVSSFLLIVFFLIIISGCKSDDSPESFIVLGDQTTIDYYFELPDNEMTLLSDEPTTEGRKMVYTHFFDLNNDNFSDITFVYEYLTGNLGEGYYFLRVELPESYQLTAAPVAAFGGQGVFPLLYAAGENLSLNNSRWTSFDNKTHLFYFELNNHQEVRLLNVFPHSNDVYLPFKIDSRTEKGMGWIHLEPTSEAWRPRILDIGFKLTE